MILGGSEAFHHSTQYRKKVSVARMIGSSLGQLSQTICKDAPGPHRPMALAIRTLCGWSPVGVQPVTSDPKVLMGAAPAENSLTLEASVLITLAFSNLWTNLLPLSFQTLKSPGPLGRFPPRQSTPRFLTDWWGVPPSLPSSLVSLPPLTGPYRSCRLYCQPAANTAQTRKPQQAPALNP